MRYGEKKSYQLWGITADSGHFLDLFFVAAIGGKVGLCVLRNTYLVCGHRAGMMRTSLGR